MPSRLILLLPALLATAAAAEVVEYRYRKGLDDICISHEAGAVEFYLEGRASVFGTAPRFLVPAPYPTPELTDGPDRTGIGVTFWPVSEADFASRLDRRRDPPPGACLERPFGHGLMRLEIDPDYQPEGIVPARCRVGRAELLLVPEDISVPTRISCPLAPRTGSCNASHYMGNGWEAQFLLPVTDLAEWDSYSLLVTEFFIENIKDCEAK